MAQLKSTEITGDLLVTNKIDTTVIDASNEIRLNGTNILSQIPVATASSIGGVKSGGNITIATNGAVTVESATNALRLMQFDTRNINNNPSSYIETGTGQIIESKQNLIIGLSVSDTYSQVSTFIPWTDSSGGWPYQIAQNAQGMFKRCGTSAAVWSNWEKIMSEKDHILYEATLTANQNTIPISVNINSSGIYRITIIGTVSPAVDGFFTINGVTNSYYGIRETIYLGGTAKTFISDINQSRVNLGYLHPAQSLIIELTYSSELSFYLWHIVSINGAFQKTYIDGMIVGQHQPLTSMLFSLDNSSSNWLQGTKIIISKSI